jgi:dihydroorotate dehydrogenase (NAD+) catalytic subunit
MIEIAGIRMRNPVMNAAGTFELDAYQDMVDLSKLGAHIPKSITWQPRDGNDQPRIFEVAGGMINCIGLQNVGAIKFVEERLPIIANIAEKFDIPIIVSIAGDSIEDFVETAVLIEEEENERVIGREINISCPNVENGLVFGTDAEMTFRLIGNIRPDVSLPLIVKLTPNATDIGSIAKAAVSAGADALSLINTVKARAYIKNNLYAGKWIVGGLSGPAIHSIALQKVAEVLEAVKVPVIGIGGISNTEDALDFFRLGVKAVGVGTATFSNPNAIPEIVDGLSKEVIIKC